MVFCFSLLRKAFGIAIAVPFMLLFSQCNQPEVQQEEEVTSGALAEINSAIRNNPNDPDNYARRAKYHQDNGNYGDAIIDIAQAMKLDSVNLGYHHLLADIYLHSAKSQYAIGTMERAAMLFPDSINTLLKLAELQLIVKQYDRMSSTLRQVLTLQPQNTDALYLLGLMYREQGDLERAIQSFQTIVELDSEDAEAWTMLGNLLDMKGDPAALQCFENAIAINPQYPQGWHSKAFYLQNHDRVPEAIEIYKHIHQIDPAYTDAWLNRGVLYLEMDSLKEASQCFDRMISLDSTSVIGYYYAGIAAQSIGDTTKALAYLNRALALDPSSARIKDALEQLN
jgi:tetratricopeptide (TPR) repeat protein